MRYGAILAVNAIIIINAKHMEKPEPIPVKSEAEKLVDPSDHFKAPIKSKEEDSNADTVPDWTQYSEGNRSDWKKYMERPKANKSKDSTGGQGDWMRFADSYMGSSTNTSDNTSSNSTEWNDGQGDGYGEPFRSKTGGDFRYKSGRAWNSSEGGWQQFAAPYSSVKPEQPGTDKNLGQSGGGNQDWNKYMGQSGGENQDWNKYMGQSGGGNQDWNKYLGQSGGGNQDWNKYMGQSGSAPSSSGGFFEMVVSGKDLNVTTDFGLGQGRGVNVTNATGGGGGGGGNQNSITAKEGKIYIRGRFMNELSSDIVPA